MVSINAYILIPPLHYSNTFPGKKTKGKMLLQSLQMLYPHSSNQIPL